MITMNHCTLKLGTGTCSGTPGTRTTHAHGLGYAPVVGSIIIVPTAPDGDSNDAAVVSLVKVDATNITVKSSAASTTFQYFILLDRDSGGRNALV